ncbi:MAG: plastocyanin/azurin family copper-binding protein [Candidatus Nitrosocaldus sp.]
MKHTSIFGSRLLLAAIASAALLTVTLFGITQTGAIPPENQHVAAHGTSTVAHVNEPQRVDLDGITLSFEVIPNEVHALDLVNMTIKITDTTSSAPVSHVDWAIIIKDPSGREVYRTSTSHSHMGVKNFNYTFTHPGKNTVHIQVASLGPKMMGMDVPKEAQTRILKSGDIMKSPEVDPNFFFGTRSNDFVVNVGSPGGVRTVSSDMGKTVELTLSTDPDIVVAGQPATLILNIKDATSGEHITHVEALVTVRQGVLMLSKSAPAGSPMMPMNGSYHGHTGQIAWTTVFPTTGFYIINIDTNSLPVSNVQYGHASARFLVLVTEGTGSVETETARTNVAPNQIVILGQAAPYYSPQNLTVKAGTTVTFTNSDFVIHTVTATDATLDVVAPAPNNIFDTGILGHGESMQIKFDKAGTYNYFCVVHPHMRGSITVTS